MAAATVDEIRAILTAQTRDFERAMGRAAKSLGVLRTASGKTDVANARMERGFRRTSRAVSAGSLAAQRSLFSLRNMILATFSVLTVRKVIKMADTMLLLRSRVKLVTKDQAELNSTLAKLFAISQRTRQSLLSTVELFARVARGRKELRRSNAELLQFTENLQKLVIVSGATAIESKNAIIQLAQGLASGELRGEELRAVMEQLPAVARAIADELGKTIGEFRKMAFAGKITGQVVVDNILKRTEKINDEFAQMPVTVEQAFQRIENEFQRVIGGTNAQVGFTQDIVKVLTQFQGTIGDPSFQKGVVVLADNMTSMLAFMVNNSDVILSVLAGLTAAALTPGSPMIKAAAGLAGFGFVGVQQDEPTINRLRAQIKRDEEFKKRAIPTLIPADAPQTEIETLVNKTTLQQILAAEARIKTAREKLIATLPTPGRPPIFQDSPGFIRKELELREAGRFTGGFGGVMGPPVQDDADVKKFRTGLQDQAAAIRMVRRELFDGKITQDEAADSLARHTALIKAGIDASTPAGAAFAGFAVAVADSRDAVLGNLPPLEQMTLDLNNEALAIRQAQAAIDLGNSSREDAILIMGLQIAAEKQGIDTTTEAGSTYLRLAFSVAKANEELSNLTPLQQYAEEAADLGMALQDAAVEGLESMEDGLIDVAKGSLAAGDAFRKFGSIVLEELARIALRKTILGPAAGFFDDFLGNIFPKLAHGGPVRPGQPVIVGEQGEEIFIPQQSGVIIPNDQLGGDNPRIGQGQGRAGAMAGTTTSASDFGLAAMRAIGFPFGGILSAAMMIAGQERSFQSSQAVGRQETKDKSFADLSVASLGGIPGSAGGSRGDGLGKGRSPSDTPGTPFARGGRIHGGQRATVGEVGPELFIPTGGAPGGGRRSGTTIIRPEVIVQMSVQTGVAGTVRAEIVQALPSVIEAATRGTMAAIRKGGVEARQVGIRG